MNIVPLSPPNLEGKKSVEFIRAWIDYGNQKTSQKFSLLPQIAEDPAAWGLVLVDIARQVALGYVQITSEKYSYEEVLLRIKQGFDAEWTCPTE
jgi:hypothetical protein